MIKTELWLILCRLPDKSLREIGKMTRSEYFNERDDVCRLLTVLCAQIKKQTVFSREAAFGAVYPGEVFDPAKFRLILHFLTEIVRQYLVLQSLETPGWQRKLALGKALESLELDEPAADSLENGLHALQTTQLRGPEWYEHYFQARRDGLRLSIQSARTQAIDLQGLADAQEAAYLITKLKIACEQCSHQAVYKVEYDYGLLKNVLEAVENDPKWAGHTGIRLYYLCCRCLMQPAHQHYFLELKPLLLKVETVFPPAECRDLVLLTLNFCIRKLNDGELQYAKEGLDIYTHALKNDYLMEKGELSRFTFRNIVAMGLKINAFDWVKSFIEGYSPKLPALHRDSMVNFSLARLEYSRGNQVEAIYLLQKADYEDILLHLAAKVMLMKIYYESADFRRLESLCDTVRIFLRRKKIMGYHRENYLNIARYFEKLMALNPYDAEAKIQLRNALLQEEKLTEKEWFVEQLK